MEELELIKKFKNGDDYALEELLKQNKPLVNKIVRKYFLVGAELDDLVQEGMIGLYRAIVSFDELKDVNFKSYAVICIQRTVFNAIKSANSKKNLPLNQSVSLTLQTDDEGEEEDEFISYETWNDSDPETILINRERYQKLLEKATQNLSVFEKNVLKLYLDGLTYSEIAEQLDKSPKSVDNGLTRIKAKISHADIND